MVILNTYCKINEEKLTGYRPVGGVLHLIAYGLLFVQASHELVDSDAEQHRPLVFEQSLPGSLEIVPAACDKRWQHSVELSLLESLET